MRKLTAREAGRYSARLDNIANALENDWETLGLSQKQATDFAFEVDKIADLIKDEAKTAHKEAKVIQGDPDEPYMADHFNQSGVRDGQQDADEPYMALFGDTPGRPSNEGGTTVIDRTEAPIEGLNTYSDGFKKQPSQPNVGGDPFPGPYSQGGKQASTGGRRYSPQTPASKRS